MALKSIGEASKKLLIETVSHRSSAGTTSASQIAFRSHGGREKRNNLEKYVINDAYKLRAGLTF